MQLSAFIDFVKNKKSCLCVGLDNDYNKLPPHLLPHARPMLAFNKHIIQATLDHCVAYKINTAFYEVLGSRGMEMMEETLELIPKSHLVIADAKRGDIGNTAEKYAQTFLDFYPFDAVTINPYMGFETVDPFLNYHNKYAIILGLTSNEGSKHIEELALKDGQKIYQKVISHFAKHRETKKIMFVVGATKAEKISEIRRIAPENFFLVPGIGAQGGKLEDVLHAGMTKDVGLLINSSRGILYQSAGTDFAEKARNAAKEIHEKMKPFIESV
ncbi:MAG: orotidine-5'-phosphate decarboxylase [Bacteroidetes bacterium TMED39]|nr:MAG: orotidine-5'-phosphate decarboxylase [Bacteroidetes bacterium TMED39]